MGGRGPLLGEMNAQKGVKGFTLGDAEMSGELIGRMLHDPLITSPGQMALTVMRWGQVAPHGLREANDTMLGCAILPEARRADETGRRDDNESAARRNQTRYYAERRQRPRRALSAPRERPRSLQCMVAAGFRVFIETLQ